MGASNQVSTPPLSQNYNICAYGYCKVWQDKNTQAETLEEYSVGIEDTERLDHYLSMILLRNSHPSLIPIKYFSHSPSKDICGLYKEGSLILERTPFRLSEFSRIPPEEIYPILDAALFGYELLHQHYGLFIVRSTMIAVTPLNYSTKQRQNTDMAGGKVKVWHHTDLSSVEPQNVHCGNLPCMIRSIVSSVELNSQKSPSPFSSFMDLWPNCANSFPDIRNYLAEYMEGKHIRRSHTVSNIIQYLRKSQGLESITQKRLWEIGGKLRGRSLERFSLKAGACQQQPTINNSLDQSKVEKGRSILNKSTLSSILKQQNVFSVDRGGVDRGGVDRGGVDRGGADRKGARASIYEGQPVPRVFNSPAPRPLENKKPLNVNVIGFSPPSQEIPQQRRFKSISPREYNSPHRCYVNDAHSYQNMPSVNPSVNPQKIVFNRVSSSKNISTLNSINSIPTQLQQLQQNPECINLQAEKTERRGSQKTVDSNNRDQESIIGSLVSELSYEGDSSMYNKATQVLNSLDVERL